MMNHSPKSVLYKYIILRGTFVPTAAIIGAGDRGFPVRRATTLPFSSVPPGYSRIACGGSLLNFFQKFPGFLDGVRIGFCALRAAARADYLRFRRRHYLHFLKAGLIRKLHARIHLVDHDRNFVDVVRADRKLLKYVFIVRKAEFPDLGLVAFQQHADFLRAGEPAPRQLGVRRGNNPDFRHRRRVGQYEPRPRRIWGSKPPSQPFVGPMSLSARFFPSHAGIDRRRSEYRQRGAMLMSSQSAGAAAAIAMRIISKITSLRERSDEAIPDMEIGSKFGIASSLRSSQRVFVEIRG